MTTDSKRPALTASQLEAVVVAAYIQEVRR